MLSAMYFVGILACSVVVVKLLLLLQLLSLIHISEPTRPY